MLKGITTFIVFLIFSGIVNFLISKAAIAISLYSSLAASAIAAILVVILFKAIWKKSTKDIGIEKEGAKDNLIFGMGVGFIFSLLLILTLLITGCIGFNGLKTKDVKEIVFILLVGIVINLFFAFAIEFLFRGLILSLMRDKVKSGTAIVASAFLYAIIIFFANGYFFGTLNVFLLGIVLGIMAVKDHSIYSAVGFQFSYGLIFSVLLYMPFGKTISYGIIDTFTKKSDIINGGSFGIKSGLAFLIVVLSLMVYFIKYLKDIEFTTKSRIFALIVALIGLFSIGYSISSWKSMAINSDTRTIKSVDRFTEVNNYNMDLTLDTENKTLSGSEDINYINNSKDTLSEVYFHAYPNAFQSQKGLIEITNISVDGKDTEFNIEGTDKTLVKVPLSDPLKPKEKTDIKMRYTVHIPKIAQKGFADRLGYGNNTYNLGNFFPIAAVYENGNWDKHLYDKKGDAFYSEVSNFNVIINAPKDQVLASSGAIQKEELQGKKKIWTIEANGVRDFAFVCSNKFNVISTNVEGIKIMSYAFDSFKNKKILNIASDAVKIYNKSFGEYPYGTLSVVQSDISGGMEYPNLVMIGNSGYDNIGLKNTVENIMYKSLTGEEEFTVVHELGHQWWYGVVGDDEYNESWIDEPLTQYSSLLYYREKYGEDRFKYVYEKSIKNIYNISTMAGNEGTMARPLDKFNENDYYNLIYNKGTIMFVSLEDELGRDKFNALLRKVYEDYKFKVIHGKDLIKMTSDIAGKDMQPFYDKWMK